MKTTSITLITVALVAQLSTSSAIAQMIPPRPEQLTFKPLSFTPPMAADFRHELSNGIVVFLAPSKELPLIDLSMSFRGGEFLEAANKCGLTGMTTALLRTGGTISMAPSDLDEKLDFLATEISMRGGGTSCSVSLDCLTSTFDESLTLLMDMMVRPRFDDAKIKVALDSTLEYMKQRNDDAEPILDREWAIALYGADHFEARQPTEASVRSITKDDMAAFASKVFNPANVVVAVSGDFEIPAMLAKLEQAFAAWPKGERMPTPPAPTSVLKPGVFHVEKEIPQGKVYIGNRSITREDPDFFPSLVMNEILGGGGFTSRIMKTVRSDEGLAYSAGSSLDPGVYYPGEFRAGFQSKSATVALAIKLIENEFRKMRDTPVSAEELEVAKQSFIETFPRSFESKPAMLKIFVGDEWTGRDSSYWTTFRANVAKVSAADVQRVAQRLLDPTQMAIYIVGDWDTISLGDATGRAKMAEFFDDQSVQIPQRDPMTMLPRD